MSGVVTAQPTKLRDWFAVSTVKQGISEALGGFMDEGNFISQMLVAFQDEKVVDCTPQSKFEAAHVCATLGLLPTLGQVALIARNIRDKGKCCTVMPQWQGFQSLMLRHPDVSDVKAVMVHVKDSYTFDPETESLRHQYDPFDSGRLFRNFDDVRGGYLVVIYKDGRPKKYHFVTVEVMKKARACAQADNIWTQWFYEQCMKTIYRNAYARRVIPIDPFVNSRLQAIVEEDDKVTESNPNISVGSATAVAYQPPVSETKPASRTEALAKKTAPKKEKPAEVPPETSPPKQLVTERDFSEAIAQAQSTNELQEIWNQSQQVDLDGDALGRLLSQVDVRHMEIKAR